MVEPVSLRTVSVTSPAVPTEMELLRFWKLIFFVSDAESSTMTRTSAFAAEVNSVRSEILLFAISLLDILGEFLFVRQYLIP